MKSQEKSWRTRKVKDNQKKTGSRVWMHRKNLTIGAKDLLKKWDDEALRKDVCVVCGDGTPRRILITHHLDPDSVSEGKITLCIVPQRVQQGKRNYISRGNRARPEPQTSDLPI
jgi:hypothetical protein